MSQVSIIFRLLIYHILLQLSTQPTTNISLDPKVSTIKSENKIFIIQLALIYDFLNATGNCNLLFLFLTSSYLLLNSSFTHLNVITN